MANRIDRLTPDQEAMIPIYRDRGLAMGMCTDRVDAESARSYGRRLMQALGRKYVARIVLPGPLHSWLAVTMLSSVSSPSRVRAQVWAQVWDQVGDQVWAQVWDQVWDQVGDQVPRLIWPYLGGALDWSAWSAWSDFFAEVLGLNLVDRGLIRDCTQFGPVFPLENIVVVCDRPQKIHTIDGLLHCEDGPSWSYLDGTKGWSINGVRVNEQIVLNPESQTIEDITQEANEEIKRIRIERFGWQRFIAETDAECLDARENPIEGTKEMLCRLLGGMVVLVCHCPSQGKVFALEVEPGVQTCEQAQGYLHSGSVIDELFGPARLVGRS